MRVVFFLTVATLLFAPTLFAQPKPIAEAELNKLKSAAVDGRSRVPYRVKMRTTGPGTRGSSESMQEYSGTRSVHHLFIARSANGVELTRTETISIGDVTYLRQKDGTWVIEPPAEPPPPPATIKKVDTGSVIRSGGPRDGSGIAAWSSTKQSAEHFYIGKETLNGQETDHYRTTRVITLDGNKQLVRRIVDDFWFNANGLMVKQTSEGSYDDGSAAHGTVTEYEYPKEIKIVAPIPN
jgi:hypothetical protein